MNSSPMSDCNVPIRCSVLFQMEARHSKLWMGNGIASSLLQVILILYQHLFIGRNFKIWKMKILKHKQKVVYLMLRHLLNHFLRYPLTTADDYFFSKYRL